MQRGSAVAAGRAFQLATLNAGTLASIGALKHDATVTDVRVETIR